MKKPFIWSAVLLIAAGSVPRPVEGAPASDAWSRLAPFFTPPSEYAGQEGKYASPLNFYDGRPVRTREEWSQRRQEILDYWHGVMGPWPALLERPRLEVLAQESRENFTQARIRVEVAADVFQEGYLLTPAGRGPFPAVFVPYYDPETSVGLKGELRDFASQLARRGFVALAIGSPGGDAYHPELRGAQCQPLSYLAYLAANGHTVLAQRPEVDAARIGIVGHSYGGKWAMFASCLYEKYACAVWSDGGIVFDEARRSVNYWEPWYLGLEPGKTPRNRGLVTPENPRTGAYRQLVADGRDLHELHALMAPRPFLVSGGSEDFPARWPALNHAIAVNRFLGYSRRVAMTNRPAHAPNVESNEQIYLFFEHFLKPAAVRPRP